MLKRLAVIFMLVAMLTSCSGEAASLISFLPPEGTETTDFGGYEFSILSCGDGTGYDPTLIKDGASALTVGQDAMISWNAHIQKTYNCTIRSDSYPASYRASGNFTPKIASGTADWSLVCVNIVDLINMYDGGFLVPWETTSIDLTNHEKYGNETFLHGASFKGLHYGITHHYWGIMAFSGMITVNNNLLKDYANVNVHELKENGVWTFDRFRELLEACTANVGKSFEVIPLTVQDGRMLVTTSLLANGGKVVEQDPATGKYSYGLTTPKALKGIEYARNLYDLGFCSHSVENGTNFYENENSVFYLSNCVLLHPIMQTMDNVDTICFPYGPDAEYGKTCSAYIQRDTNYVTCPISADYDLTGKFVSLWFENTPGYTKEDIVEDFKATMFYNNESMEEVFYMLDNFSYNYYAQFGALHEKFDGTLEALAKGKGTVREELDKTNAMLSAQINKVFNED